MPKQWDKQDATSAYMYIANGMFFKLTRGFGNEWYAGLNVKSMNLQIEIMSWEFENIASIESAKALAYEKLKLWLQELVESL